MNNNTAKQYAKITNVRYCIFDKIHQEFCVIDYSHLEFSNHKFVEFNNLEDASNVIHLIKSQHPDRDFVIKKITQKHNIMDSRLDNFSKTKLFSLLKKNYHYTELVPMINILSYYTDQKFLLVFSSNKKTKEIRQYIKTHLDEKTFSLSSSIKVFFTNDIAKIICFKLIFDELNLIELIDLEKMEYLNT